MDRNAANSQTMIYKVHNVFIFTVHLLQIRNVLQLHCEVAIETHSLINVNILTVIMERIEFTLYLSVSFIGRAQEDERLKAKVPETVVVIEREVFKPEDVVVKNWLSKSGELSALSNIALRLFKSPV